MTKLEKTAKDERVSTVQLEGGLEDGQWAALDYRGTYLCIRKTKTGALEKGVEMAQQKRFSVCGFH